MFIKKKWKMIAVIRNSTRCGNDSCKPFFVIFLNTITRSLRGLFLQVYMYRARANSKRFLLAKVCCGVAREKKMEIGRDAK